MDESTDEQPDPSTVKHVRDHRTSRASSSGGLPVRTRVLIALNLVAAAVAVVVGAVSIREAQRTIEQKLVFESVQNMAALASELRLPPTKRFMEQLGRIGGADMAALDRDSGTLLASTFTPELAVQFTEAYPGRDESEGLALAGRTYRTASAPVSVMDAHGSVPAYRLVLLMPAEQVRAAQRRSVVRITLAALAAILGATCLGFWIATAITRPLRDLVIRVNRLAPDAGSQSGGHENTPERTETPGHAEGTGPDTADNPDNARIPAEIARLSHSFEQLEQRLAEAHRRLARSARLATVGQLATAIAHELRNPLSGMKMNARVLADELAEHDRARDSVDWIIREIDRLDQVVGDLLKLRQVVGDGRQRALSMPGPGRNVDMRALIRDTTQNLARRCEHAGVALCCDVAVRAAEAVADPDAVRQVLMNLILNALDAVAGQQNGRIDVSVTENGAGFIRCTVRDNGPGIGGDPDRLFEPFYTTKPHGTGLGLYICREIVGTYGGSIGCEARAPGTAFWFELPKSEHHEDHTQTADHRR